MPNNPTPTGAAPRDEAREKLVADLQAQIVDGEADGSEETDASWGYETGVLLSRAEARIALAALLAAAPRADPVQEQARAWYRRLVLQPNGISICTNPPVTTIPNATWDELRGWIRSIYRAEVAAARAPGRAE